MIKNTYNVNPTSSPSPSYLPRREGFETLLKERASDEGGEMVSGCSEINIDEKPHFLIFVHLGRFGFPTTSSLE